MRCIARYIYTVMTCYLKEWFTYEKVTPRQGSDQPSSLVFHGCYLVRPLVQFPRGCFFRSIELNACGVMLLNIPGEKKHPFDPPGYNYLGDFKMEINGYVYDSLFGPRGFCDVISAPDAVLSTLTGFSVNACTCNENTKLYPRETRLENVVFNLTGGHFISQRNHYSLKLHLSLRGNSIPTSYLFETHLRGELSDQEYADVVERREVFAYDVEGPAWLKRRFTCRYVLDESGMVMCKYLYDRGEDGFVKCRYVKS